MRLHALGLVLLFGVALGAAKEAPFSLPRSAPEPQGISSADLLGFVNEAEQKLNALHSFMLVRHGQVVAEGWWKPYAADEPHMLYSLSKSFTSTAVGLAVAEGKLKVDDPVLGFFPAEAPAEPSANLKAMRVRDLLTMSTGHHEDDVKDFPYQSDDSVVKAVSGASRFAQTGDVLLLQHAGKLHAVGDRAEGHRAAGCRVPAPTPLRSARDREPDLGREQAGRLARWVRLERSHRRHRAVRAALPAKRDVAGQATPSRRLGRDGHFADDVERQLALERLGAGVRLPVLAEPPRLLPWRRRPRAVLPGAASARHSRSRSRAALATWHRS